MVEGMSNTNPIAAMVAGKAQSCSKLFNLTSPL